MEQTGDKLVTCKCCGSDACYESTFTTEEGPITEPVLIELLILVRT